MKKLLLSILVTLLLCTSTLTFNVVHAEEDSTNNPVEQETSVVFQNEEINEGLEADENPNISQTPIDNENIDSTSGQDTVEELEDDSYIEEADPNPVIIEEQLPATLSSVSESDINVSFDSDLGIIINADDKEFLKNIDYVSISNSDYNHYFYENEDELIYNKTNGYILISNNVLNENKVMSGKYTSVYISSNDDYFWLDELQLNVTTSTQLAPTDIAITFNSSVGVIINSINKTYLQSVTGISFSSSSVNNSFYAYKNELCYDNTNKYLYISNSVLNNRKVLSATYDSWHLYADSYKDYSLTKQTIAITTSVQKPPTNITVSFNSNVGIIVNSQNKTYLQSITAMSIYSEQESCNGYFGSNELEYDSVNKYLYITNSTILKNNLVSGLYNRIYIYADGYSSYYNENATLNIVTSIQLAPSDLSISFDNNIGVVIKSANKSYLQNITHIYLRSNDIDCSEDFYKSSSEIKYDTTNKYAYIPNKELVEGKLLSGTYNNIDIYADGYKYIYLYNQTLNITTTVQNAPDDLEISFDSDVGVIINSENKDYLKDVKRISIYSNALDKSFELNKEYAQIRYDSYENYLFIPNDKLVDSKLVSQTYNSVTIYSNSYINITLKYQKLNIVTSVQYPPSDLSITFNGNVGVIFNSSNKDYLQNIDEIFLRSKETGCYNYFHKYNNNSDVNYDSANKYAYIPISSLDEGKLLSGKYNEIEVYADGYINLELENQQLNIVTSVQTPPSDVSVSFNSNVGIIINSTNKNYLQNIDCVFISSNELGCHGDFQQVPTNLKYDSSKQYTYIPISEINKQSLLSGCYDSITILADYYTRKELEDYYLYLTTTVKNHPSDIDIYFDSDVGIIINSANKNYLQNINLIYFSSDNNDFFDFDNWGEIEYNTTYNYSYISNDELIDDKVPSGTYSDFLIYSTGYTYYRNNSIELNVTTNIPFAPDDLNIIFNSDVGLVITSENQEYLKKIEGVRIYLVNMGDCIDLWGSEISYSNINKYAYITNKVLEENKVKSGLYHKVEICAEDYVDIYLETPELNIITTIQTPPSDIVASFDSDVGIIINSTNKTYLQRITSLEVGLTDNDYRDYYDFYKSSENLKYDIASEYLYVPISALENSKVLSSKCDFLRVCAKGFEDCSLQNQNFNIVTSIQKVPSDISVSFNSDVGVIIKSSNNVYLQDITCIGLYSDTLGSYGNFYKDEDELKYNSTKKYLYIPITCLNDANLSSGTYNRIYLYADKYLNKYFEDFDLSITTSVQKAPSDLKFTFNNGVGIIINSANKTYLQKVEYIFVGSSANDCCGFYYVSNNDIIYDSNNKYLYIPNSVLEDDKLLSGVYDTFELEAKGYEHCRKTPQLSITTEIKLPPTDLTISFDNSVGIIFNTQDKAYLQDINSIYFHDENLDESYSAYKSSREIKYDQINEYLYIPNNYFKENRMMSGVYKDFEIRNHKYIDNDLDKQEVEIVTSILFPPKDISVSFNSNIGIIINSQDKEYLQNIDYVRLYSNENELDGSFSKSSNNLIYDTINNYLYISDNALLDEKLMSGAYDEIKIKSIGYSTLKLEDNLYIIASTQYSPSDLSFSFNSDVGIIINSANKNYLKNIEALHISSSTVDGYGYFTNENRGIKYNNSANYAYIPKEKLYDAKMLSGNYNWIHISSYGYQNTSFDNLTLKISTTVKTVPKITVKFDSKVGLIINSSDYEYLKNIESIGMNYTEGSNGYSCYIDNVQYNSSSKYAFLSVNTLNEYKIKSGTYGLYNVIAKGYANNYVDLDVTLSTSVKEKPKDINIYYSPNIGVIINSANKDYLQKVTYVGLSGEEGFSSFEIGSGDLTYKKNEGYLLIGQESLNDSFLVSQNIEWCSIYANMYTNYDENTDFSISTNVQPADNIQLTCYFDEDVGLIIDSQNKDYLEIARFANLRINYQQAEFFLDYDEINERCYVSIYDLVEKFDTFENSLKVKQLYILSPGYGYKYVNTENLYLLLTEEVYNNYLRNHYEFEITYVLDGDAINNEENPSGYYFGDTIVLKSPTKPGCTFAGWYNCATDTKVTSITSSMKGDIYLYAKWIEKTYKLVYNANGGTGTLPSSTTYKTTQYNEVTNMTPTKKGYEFLGWSLDAKDSSPTYYSGDEITGINGDKATGSTITLYAIYSPITYSIRLNNNGGDLVVNQKYDDIFAYETSDILSAEYNILTPTIKLPKLEKDGYTFSGWYKDVIDTKGNTKQVKLTSITKSCEDLELYAVFKPITYSIKYNLNGGKNNSLNPSSYNADTPMFYLKSPTREGYTFDGWYTKYTKDTKNKVEYFENYISSISPEDRTKYTLYAKWRPINYRIRFVSNLDDSYKTLGCAYGNSYKLDNDIFNIPGKVVSKWSYSDSTGKIKTIAGNATIKNLTSTSSDEITLYVSRDKNNNELWTYNKYSIKYVLNGGKNVSANKLSFTSQSTLTFQDPTRKNADFLGWYLDPNFDYESRIESTEGIYENITLYALWDVDQYTITYDLDGGINNPSNPTTYIDGASFTLQKPTKQGYTFVGWYDFYTNKQVKSVTASTKTCLDLYALWKENQYTITYNTNGGYKYNPSFVCKQIEPYSRLTLLDGDDFYRPGYTLLGYSTNKNSLVPEYQLGESNPNLAKTSLTLYAIWGLEGQCGQCGENAYYKIDGNTMLLYGKGEVSNFTYSTPYKSFYDNEGKIKIVKIYEGITEVIEDALPIHPLALYLPKTFVEFGYDNLSSIGLKVIYYAGNETEWKNVWMKNNKSYLTVVNFNSKY